MDEEDDMEPEPTAAAPAEDGPSTAEAAELVRLCGGEEMATRVRTLWEDLIAKGRLDVSKQRLGNDDIKLLIKGIYSMAQMRAKAQIDWKVVYMMSKYFPLPPEGVEWAREKHAMWEDAWEQYERRKRARVA